MEVDESMQWFRWWHDATTDGKLLRLSFQHRWLWIALLTLASKSPTRGSLYVSTDLPCDINDVAREANMAPNICLAGIELMMRPQFKMLDVDENGAWRIVKWDKRQPKREDPTNAERQQRYRNAHRNATSNAPDTETDSETDSDKKHMMRRKVDYSEKFEEFWHIYPRKVNKKGANNVWKARMNDGVEPDKLILAATNYAAKCKRVGTEEQFILHAATFLGLQERWKEYLVTEAQPEQTVVTPAYGSPGGLAMIENLERLSRGGQH